MPPRRQSAPKGESKTGLIIALVFFILTTIALGVVAYMGYDGQKQLEEAATQAKKDTEAAQEASRQANSMLMAHRIMEGTFLPNEDLGQFTGNAKFKEELEQILVRFQPFGISWGGAPGTDKPLKTIRDVLQENRQKTEVAEKNSTASIKNADDARTDYTAKEATAVAKSEQSRKDSQRYADEVVAANKAVEEAKKFQVNQIGELSAKLKKLQEDKDTLESEKNIHIKKLEEDIANARQTIEKLTRDQDARRAGILVTDQPKGRVTKVDSVAGIAYINLGSADFVRPGMTFSILMKYDASRYGAEDPLPKKATLVVNQVMGEHLSRTSIEFDPSINAIQDPIEVGDTLYKPGWKPGTAVHWALVGHFDLNGLGRDETLLLKNRLEKQGIIVDAYLDLNTLKVVGDLNANIDYLIVGSRPTGETARVIGEDRKKAIEDAMNNMIEAARAKSITVMQGRVFLPVSGIDLPRHQALPYFPGGPAPAAAGTDKGKDEGK
jgi:hypothetical protein